MQVFTDDGARVEIRVDGDGHPDSVVLIHGFPLTHDVWRTQAKALSRTHRVISPDLRGAGASSVSDGPYLMEMLAADIAATLDSLGTERVSLVGHSMGGYVALAFARMFTERVKRLVLVSSKLAADTMQQAQQRRDLADRVERSDSIEPILEAYLPLLLAPSTYSERHDLVKQVAEIARRANPMGAAATLRGMAVRASGEDIAEDLDVPMLMIAGGCDAIVSSDEARAITKRFSRGKLVICERSGHLPMLEEPDRVSQALIAEFSE